MGGFIITLDVTKYKQIQFSHLRRFALNVVILFFSLSYNYISTPYEWLFIQSIVIFFFYKSNMVLPMRRDIYIHS